MYWKTNGYLDKLNVGNFKNLIMLKTLNTGIITNNQNLIALFFMETITMLLLSRCTQRLY
jgi:hypothetical protein